jgi:hypothetical protein
MSRFAFGLRYFLFGLGSALNTGEHVTRSIDSAARLSQTFDLEFFSSLSAVAAASFNPASMRSHSRPHSGPVLPRDLTEPSRFKNSFAPIRLLRIFILQLLRGDLCNTISYQTDATCLTRNWA